MQENAPAMQALSKPATRNTEVRPNAESAPVRFFAAGSLKAAFGEMEHAMAADGLPAARFTFGASGLLKDRIAGGDACDVFASANMAHPQAVARPGVPVTVFARNTLCALARADFGVTSETLVECMLDPGIRLGTSTPGNDPSGDYAELVFAKAEAMRPGARAALAAKARALTGGAEGPRPADGRSIYAGIMARGDADIFLTYVTNALTVAREVPGVAVVELPPDLAVAADYGLVVLSERETAGAMADWLLSPAGQDILFRHGFQRPAPKEEDRA
jgi:ABC-type molybdate transport system substrate-binding protein